MCIMLVDKYMSSKVMLRPLQISKIIKNQPILNMNIFAQAFRKNAITPRVRVRFA